MGNNIDYREYDDLKELETLCLEAIKGIPKENKMIVTLNKLAIIAIDEKFIGRKLTKEEKNNIPEGVYKIELYG